MPSLSRRSAPESDWGAMRASPIVSFEPITLAAANEKLSEWGHKMGPLHRGNQGAICHGLFSGSELVAVTTVSPLIAPNVGGGMKPLTRESCCELSRLCAARSGLCRVALRLWREFVFPGLGKASAISYQDADLHSGHTYRFDGWKRAAYARSGTDTRSGRKGRNKWVWVWGDVPVIGSATLDARDVVVSVMTDASARLVKRGEDHA